MDKIKSYLKILSNPRQLAFVLMEKYFNFILSDKHHIIILFYLRFHYRIDLNAPKTYNEKIQWLKLNDRNPEYVKEVDKYAVRKIIQKMLPSCSLIPLLGVYDNPREIDFDALPSRFVLKCNHGTHCSIVCKNKNTFDIFSAKKQLDKWLKHNYYYNSREYPYKNIPPKILIEEYLADSAGELVDYKFMCFNGSVKLILVHQNILSNGQHTLDIYTPDWQLTDIEWGVPRSGIILPKPEKLDECVHVSEKLSVGKPHVRVDLYIVDDKIYFGELTYYTASGLKPFKRMEDDSLLGSWIQLDNI